MSTKLIGNSRVSALAKLDRMLQGKAFRGARFFIVLDENSYACCLPQVISRVTALQEAEFFEVPVGEECKSLEVAAQLWGALLESGADRNSVIVNLGGGAVSDLGGFVAAGFKRGIRYINIPTTLTAMVDAAIGGKTAVNVENAKNQVGFFHQPVAVCCDEQFLSTLPQAELVDGTMEVAKTLMLSDPDAFDMLDERPLAAPEVIAHCVHFKLAVVKSDPHEASLRKILNLGHTFGHGIESWFRDCQRPISHGRAVGYGMWCAIYLSVGKLGLAPTMLERYSQWLKSQLVIPRITLKDTEGILGYMRSDKKNADGEILAVLLQAPGTPVIDMRIDENEVRDALLRLK